MNQLLSTDAVPRDQRLAYWTDMICNVYVQLGCDPVRECGAGSFEGSIRQHTLPSLDVSVVKSGPQKVMRTPGHISRSGDDYFLVSIQARGHGVTVACGQAEILHARELRLGHFEHTGTFLVGGLGLGGCQRVQRRTSGARHAIDHAGHLGGEPDHGAGAHSPSRCAPVVSMASSARVFFVSKMLRAC